MKTMSLTSVDEHHEHEHLRKLTFREALPLARKLRSDLRPHTRDLESHGRCFEDSRAVEWARGNTGSDDEDAAVGRLNELVGWGLLVHTTDPFKRFGVGGTNASYFRTVDAILDAELTSPTTGPAASSEGAGGRTKTTAALTFREARSLARRLRADLAPHTKDRRRRLKSYGKGFRASRALEWARDNVDPDEEAAVGRLSELVDLGLLVPVVDPSRKLEAGVASRALYLRTVDSVLDADLTSVATEGPKHLGTSPRPTNNGGERGRPKLILVNGEIGSRMHLAGPSTKVNPIPTERNAVQRPEDLDQASQQTVRVRNDARGNLEVVRHDWSVRRCRD